MNPCERGTELYDGVSLCACRPPFPSLGRNISGKQSSGECYVTQLLTIPVIKIEVEMGSFVREEKSCDRGAAEGSSHIVIRSELHQHPLWLAQLSTASPRDFASNGQGWAVLNRAALEKLSVNFLFKVLAVVLGSLVLDISTLTQWESTAQPGNIIFSHRQIKEIIQSLKTQVKSASRVTQWPLPPPPFAPGSASSRKEKEGLSLRFDIFHGISQPALLCSDQTDTSNNGCDEAPGVGEPAISSCSVTEEVKADRGGGGEERMGWGKGRGQHSPHLVRDGFTLVPLWGGCLLVHEAQHVDFSFLQQHRHYVNAREREKERERTVEGETKLTDISEGLSQAHNTSQAKPTCLYLPRDKTRTDTLAFFALEARSLSTQSICLNVLMPSLPKTVSPVRIKYRYLLRYTQHPRFLFHKTEEHKCCCVVQSFYEGETRRERQRRPLSEPKSSELTSHL
ncbi:hypothetical protein JZ751_025894 [Albula glossodonta]|uniref:Uncharacterized protein n=1 Tax=Albula glossodonta TaxID=121402 RepID=A0A8T2NPN2_9TELE|nr:hypothetical protein JZ751_025894 [Albula glossodonta]